MRHHHGEAIAGGFEALLGAHLRGLRQARKPERVEVAGLHVDRVDYELLALVAADRAAHVRMVGDRVRRVSRAPPSSGTRRCTSMNS